MTETPAPRDPTTVAAKLEAVAAILDLTPAGLAEDPTGVKLLRLIAEMDADGAERGDPSREIFARLGDKWSTLLILLLRIGTMRHATLRRLASAVGMDGAISQRMLTLRLRALERDGLISRRTVCEKPLKVEYALTPLGLGLAGQIDGLLDWIRRHAAAIEDAREDFARRDD